MGFTQLACVSGASGVRRSVESPISCSPQTADQMRTIVMVTRPWNEIIARYRDYDGEHRSIRALESLARRISESQLGKGLFAWTSMYIIQDSTNLTPAPSRRRCLLRG